MVAINKKSSQPVKPSLKDQRARDMRPVTGKFIFHEVPGGSMSFNYKKYLLDDVQRYDMVDGQVYTIPYGVAVHLNKNCAYPEHSYILDDYGKPMQRVSKMIRRCSFQSLDFMDTDDLLPAGSGNSDIVAVENLLAV